MDLPIFVYGTLMPGFPNFKKYLKGRVRKATHASTKGKMYSVNSHFPAVVEGNNIIKGYLLYLEDIDVLEKLDELEGCLYSRVIVETFLNNGKPIFAWMYLWVLPTDQYLEIPNGDWASYTFLPSLKLGDVYATPRVLDTVSNQDILSALKRHARCDWGDVCEKDWKLNDEALEMGYRILSSYTSTNGIKFWVITEADRNVTTILLPEEY